MSWIVAFDFEELHIDQWTQSRFFGTSYRLVTLVEVNYICGNPIPYIYDELRNILSVISYWR